MPIMRCGVPAVEALRAVGVTTIFRLMGSSTLEIYDALYDAKDMHYIGVRHENCGMHRADAYGRAAQTPGVFPCGQAGPGAANMVLGLAQAKLAMPRWWSSPGYWAPSTSDATPFRRLTSTSCASR